MGKMLDIPTESDGKVRMFSQFGKCVETKQTNLVFFGLFVYYKHGALVI